MRKTLYIACAVAAAAVGLAGCGTVTPKALDLQTANFGPAPDQAAVLKSVQAWVGPKLRDPMSAVYECGPPRKAWTNVFGKITYGWAVSCTVNAKNAYGGYVGPQRYGFLFQGERIVQDAWANIGYVD